ncbi:MAG: hypothetical protein IAF58_04445 [Leptolyngbya sp.]|nr:hypothetical protein [Candidatus Melainabacteria bacterium]
MDNISIKQYDTGFQALLRSRESFGCRRAVQLLLQSARNREAAEIAAAFEREMFASETAAAILQLPMKQKAKILSLPIFRDETKAA